jgi:hypothetical protein
MAPAPAKALTFDPEGDAGNAYYYLRELFDFERLGRLGRLEDSVCAALQLAMCADAARGHRARRPDLIDARIEDRASRRERVGKDQVG